MCFLSVGVDVKEGILFFVGFRKASEHLKFVYNAFK